MATAGLFDMLGGGNEASMQRQLEEQQASEYAKLSAEQRNARSAYSAGAGLTKGIAGAFGLDVTDPTIRQAAELRRMASEYDVSSPEGLMQMAQAIRSTNPQMAVQLAEKAQSMQKTMAETAKDTATANRERATATPADIQKAQRIAAIKQAIPAYEQAGDTTSAQLLKNELKSLEPTASLSPFGKLLTEAGIPEGSNQYKKLVKDFADATLAGEKKGKGTTITNVVGKDAGDVVALRKDVQATTKPYQDQLDAAEDAIDLANNAIKTGNFAAVSTLSRSLAKAAGEAQLSRNDVEAFGADPSLVGGIADTVARLSKGRPTVDTLTKLRDLATILQAKAGNKLSLEEQQTRNVAKASGNYTDAQIDTIFPRRPKSEVKTEFGSLSDAEAANLPKGTIITINGRRARVE